ncbi:MAG TPA: hypothetical protein VGB38_08410, partial [bacterium]
MKKSTLRLACVMTAFFTGMDSSVAQWVHTENFVNIVNCITASPAGGISSRKLYAGSRSGGV